MPTNIHIQQIGTTKERENAVDMQLASAFLCSFFILVREFTRRVDLDLEMAGYWTGLDLGRRRDDLACSLFPLPLESPCLHTYTCLF